MAPDLFVLSPGVFQPCIKLGLEAQIWKAQWMHNKKGSGTSWIMGQISHIVRTSQFLPLSVPPTIGFLKASFRSSQCWCPPDVGTTRINSSQQGQWLGAMGVVANNIWRVHPWLSLEYYSRERRNPVDDPTGML